MGDIIIPFHYFTRTFNLIKDLISLLRWEKPLNFTKGGNKLEFKITKIDIRWIEEGTVKCKLNKSRFLVMEFIWKIINYLKKEMNKNGEKGLLKLFVFR